MSRCVILVDFYWTRDKDPRVPLGHASILTALRQRAELEVHPIVVAVNAPHLDAPQIASEILNYARGRDSANVDVAFGAYVWGEQLLQSVISLLKHAGFQGRIILGGPQISYNGQGLERLYPHADVFVRGYGETVLGELAQTNAPKAMLGVHWAGAPDTLSQAAVNLEALPSPWLTGVIPLENQRFIRWETQRGCPFRCSFCQHREPGARLIRRALDLPRIEAEIDLFCRSDVREIAVLDPIFNMAPHAVGVLERFASHGFTGRMSLQCRAEAIGQDFLDVAAQLDTCLEFGLQTIHEQEGRAIDRRNHLGRVDAALAGARARSIPHEVSLIFGLPLQTVQSFEESIAWCLERQVPVIKAFPLLLLRGTALERDRARWGLEMSDGPMPLVFRSHHFDEAGWVQMAQLSEALRITEGAHPKHIEDLKRIATGLEPDLLRWLPADCPTPFNEQMRHTG